MAITLARQLWRYLYRPLVTHPEGSGGGTPGVVLGPELVLNGGMVSPGVPWTASNSAVLDFTGNVGKVTNDATGTNNGGMLQSATLTSGARYFVSVNVTARGATAAPTISIGGTVQAYGVGTGVKTFTVTSGAPQQFVLSVGAATASETVTFDNFSVRRIL